jgi:uncharacterized protein
MNLDETLVIDATAHAIDNSLEQRAANRYARAVIDGNMAWQEALMPAEWVLERERYLAKVPPEMLLSVLFKESQTDIACFHSIAMRGIFKDYSPITVGLAIREQYPHRMMLMGPISPFDGASAACEEIERQVAEWQIDGIKMYPLDLVDGNLRSFSMGDEELMYPIFEKCRDLGLKVVSIHKAVPLGIAPMDPFRPSDVDYAAKDFPDLNFEVVHAGLSFLDESAFQVARYPNVYINLEGTIQYIIRRSGKFAEIMGEFMLVGGADRILWSTGCSFTHPQPLLEAFATFQMPQHMLDGGYPPFTDEIREDILGLNFCRMHGLDPDDLRAKVADDDLEHEKRTNGLAAPWSEARVPVAS